MICRCLLGSGKHVVNGGSELVRPGTWDDDGISPAMGFLGNAKESSSIVFTEFHIEVLPLDLDLLRFDNIVHVGPEFGRLSSFVEAKNSLNFTTQKANVWPRLRHRWRLRSGRSGPGLRSAIAKSICRLNSSTRATCTRNLSPTAKRRRCCRPTKRRWLDENT